MQDEETVPVWCEYPEMSYEDRLAEASERAQSEYLNAMWNNHQVLGILEREFGLEFGTLDEWKIE